MIRVVSGSPQGVPPSIDGYTYESWLGGGGFADVFLYDQHLLQRRVAIKVLRETVDDQDARRLFAAEANLMAKVSTHPNIVTIHSAGVSADRRPYLVMEYYPLDHFGERIRKGRAGFQDVLQIGVKLACAVETAHQARIVHRDIKPANVLVSDFGEPGLTDFGISATQTDQATDESVGFSPPYAPPEILADTHPGDARSDIYSLAATLWAMLAGHAPFERPGVKNTRGELMARGMNDPVPPLPPGTAPQSLEALLRRGLEKLPDRRQQTAREMAEALQAVERELGLRETPLVLMHDRAAIDTALAEVEVAVERTKRGAGIVLNLDPSATDRRTTKRGSGAPGAGVIGAVPTSPLAAPTPGPAVAAPPPTPLPHPVAPAAADTVVARRVAPVDAPAPSAPARRFPTWAWAALVVLVLAVGGLAAVGLRGGGDEKAGTPTTVGRVDDVANPGDAGDATLEPVADLTGRRDGDKVVFTWTHAPKDGLRFLVERVDSGTAAKPQTVDVATFTIDGVPAGTSPCIAVTAVIEGKVTSTRSDPRCIS